MNTFLNPASEFSIDNHDMEIKITNEDYINMTLKNKIITLKSLIEMWKMTVNDPKFDIKKSLDTLTDQIYLTGCLYFVRYWAICVL